MVSSLKEQENFLRNAILTVDHSKEVLQCFLEQHLKNNDKTFDGFLNQNQHDIYHLYYDAKCCQCGPGPLQRKKRILSASQMELLFDKNQQLLVHKMTRHSDFCCCCAKKGVTTAILDLTLARCLLMNCCIDMFWYSCLAFKGITFEQFLNSNKHILYHLWKSNNTCCMCPADFKFPCENPLIMESEWKKMFSSTLPPCENDRKRPATGAISICSFAATPSITVQQIHLELQNIILKYCCSTRKSVEKLAELRNLTFGHVKKASMSCTEFNTVMSEAEDAILDIATVCGKEDYYRQMLLDLRDKPLDTRMFCQYEKVLLQTIGNYEDIIKYNEVLKDEIDSLKENIEKLCRLQREGSKRQRLIGETLAEIDNHKKDQTYTEIKAVTACVQMLDNSKVLILSGREGSGKSKNSLEILRQIKDKHPEIDVIKLKRLAQFTDIIEKDANTIVLFEDVFGRIRKQFDETYEQILDILHSYINFGYFRVIFVMRNTVKHECQSLLSSHDIFCNSVAYLDLSSEEFGLSLKERERLFINYCTTNEIDIIYRKKPSDRDLDDYEVSFAQNISIDKIKVPITDKPDVLCRFSEENNCIVFNSFAVEDMIRSDPYQGFPQCCRLFTRNKNVTALGAPFFKFPSKSLLQEIENMRIEGIDNGVKGLKYVILVYILLNPAPSSINIDVEAHQKLFNECYNKTFGLKSHDIIYLYEELTCRYLIRKKHMIYFQHRALQESVLISYCKTNPKAVIPLLNFDHMVDIVRTENYKEQYDEIVIQISKPNYHELAKKIISLINGKILLYCYRELDRLMESKLFTDNDVDLVYQLIVCIKNDKVTSSSRLYSYTYHYFPLYLLRNLGKLGDKRLTVDHTLDQMLISVVIGNHNITFFVDPFESLTKALHFKYKDIVQWLLENTKHSLIDFTYISVSYMTDKVLGNIKLLLENVKHSRIDMNRLFTEVCLKGNNVEKHAATIDWMLDNVDNSLIDFNECIENIVEVADNDITLHILKKINHRWLDFNNVVKVCCKHGCSEIVEWILKNVDNECFDEEELLNITINGYYTKYAGSTSYRYGKIVELLILQKPEICFRNINKLSDMATRKRWYGVLELLLKHDSNLSINKDRIIAYTYKCVQYADDEYEEDEYGEYEYEEDEYGEYEYEEDEYEEDDNDAYCLKIVKLIMKYHLDIDVNKLIEKTVQVGLDNILEELLLDKVDNLSYYLDITLKILRHKLLSGYIICCDTGHGKILMLLLPRINYNTIDLNSVMDDVCNIGHSPAVLWLLENKPAYPYDMKNVMNKAAYHGALQVVEYLYQKYDKEDFDYKIAMVKACRNSHGETLDVCKWLWENNDRGIFDMKTALNNASRYDNYEVVKWILTDVDTELLDTEAAVFFACEHGSGSTVDMLLDKFSINMIDIQSAIKIACRNVENGLSITKLLYERADQSTIDINNILSAACKNYRIDIIQWIIETCDQNLTETETNNGNKHFIKSIDKDCVDMDQAVTCLLDMDAPEQEKRNVAQTKNKFLWLILNKSDPSKIHIYKLLTEACKNDWVDIFKWILGRVDHACLNIGEIINVACRYGAFNIIKWSLENIDMRLVDVDNVMVESCGFGWLECLVLIWKHCYQYKLQDAMTEACTYGRLHIAEWLLRNVPYQLFNISMLLQEAGRNGWINIFCSLLHNVHFEKSDMHIATRQALENGHLEIAELVISTVGKDCLSFSSLSENIYMGANKEGMVNFLLHNIDLKGIDIGTIMINACLFGWKDIATFIVDRNLTSLCDLSLAFNTACDNGELEIAQLLLEKVDPRILTTVDKAMRSVSVKGWDEIALLLLDKVEHTRLDIGNALNEACRHGEIDIVQAILRKVDNNMLDVETALNKACENYMHEELVLWVLENIDQEQVDLKTVKKRAIRHKWWKVQFELTKVDTEDLFLVEQDIETDCIVIS